MQYLVTLLDSITKIDIDIILGGVPKTILSVLVPNLSTAYFVSVYFRLSFLSVFVWNVFDGRFRFRLQRYRITKKKSLSVSLRICLQIYTWHRRGRRLININYSHDIDRWLQKWLVSGCYWFYSNFFCANFFFSLEIIENFYVCQYRQWQK